MWLAAFFFFPAHSFICLSHTENPYSELLLSAGRNSSPGRRGKAFLCHMAAPEVTVKIIIWQAKCSAQT